MPSSSRLQQSSAIALTREGLSPSLTAITSRDQTQAPGSDLTERFTAAHVGARIPFFSINIREST